MKGLLLGSSDKEHILAFMLKQANADFVCISGNDGISQLCKCVDIPISNSFLSKYLKRHPVDYVISSEKYLLSDLNTQLRKEMKVFGPNINQIDSLNLYNLKQYDIPIIHKQIFFLKSDVYQYLTNEFSLNYSSKLLNNIVVHNIQEAQVLLDQLNTKKFIIEDCESYNNVFVIHCLLDGKNMLPLIPAKSYKQIYDYNSSLTNGMGSIAPFNVDNEQLLNILNSIKIMLKEENLFYQGCLSIEFSILNNNLYISDLHPTWKDPEIQAVLPLLKNNFYNLIEACFNGTLDKVKLEWYDLCTCCLVLVSQGYPFKYRSYKSLKIENTECIVLHAGTYFNDERNQLFTNGGRVLNLLAIENTVELAREKVYKNITNVNYKNIFYRANIGYEI